MAKKNTNTNKNKNNGNNKKRNNNRNHKNNNFKPRKEENKILNDGICEYEEGITVDELAQKINHTPAEVIKVLFMLGTMVTINTALNDEQVELICLEYGYEPKKIATVDETNFEDLIEPDKEEDLVPRPPVVTIMGHVDHGKTTLLDYIRKSHVAEGESGGITQHIGAYQVDVNGKKVTFLDTPGHEAFTAMRARGAQVTDIVIIVVAADDGVMPQTREAIDHAKAAGVPIIVAVNKIDKPGASPDRIRTEMSEFGLMPEEWGGDVVYQDISAKKGTGVQDLLEAITVVAEMAELKANPNRAAYGTVVEARLDKGRGPVATLLVENGTLHPGDPIVVGTTYGRVRQMTGDNGRTLKKATPATPVAITGLNEVPEAGDKFMVFDSDKTARHIGEARAEKKKEEERNTTSAMSLDDLYNQIKEGQLAQLNVIVKADVDGTAEAVKATLEKINIEGAKVNVIRSTVGAITESDVLLASASKAIIYGFNVRPTAAVRRKAEEEGVEIRLHNIIYKMVEEIEAAMKGMLAPELEEVVTGQAEIREIYKVSKIGNIAGCMVTDGCIKRDCGVRLIRDGVVVYEGKLASLRRFKDDVKQVNQGYDCGLTIENFNDIKIGDIVEGFVMEEVEA
ncbi:translation initiation factor IF-2 [Sharpea azabuensis]|uniref:Translation initiation factor IF-2 n=1 Tax=Sharpea azabuensis TaxID=322505 RepID=A0A1H6QDH3_9FIRM|nr:translation initiation factor IF-2 [Sharpea azabuensis]MDD6513595.1 translation initiation factor IF-2 [Sharpea azabuensis]MEE3308604.1 translation initiation factor IF-2 [Sharpea azabuensis]SEI37305.1 translation initiation factor IF-2 [Sharpea azabuensis]HBZ51180.1 translation initiation factor IF-2 [Erysipelotrichaceae bacterium]